MNEIQRLLWNASRRLVLMDLVRTSVWTVTLAMGLVVIARIVERVFGLDWTWAGEWKWITIVGAAGSMATSAAWTFAARARGVRLAQVVDERAGLREALSTALCVAKHDDPWAKNVVESAREKAVGVDVNRAIPYEPPALWPMPIAAGLSLLVVWFSVPRLDVMGLFAKKEEVKKRELEIVQVKAEVKAKEEKLDEMLKKAGVDSRPGEKDQAGELASEKPMSADELRRVAIKKLTGVQEALQAKAQGEKAQTLEAIRQQMKQLKQPGPGPMEALSKAMAQGKFDEAGQELAELQKKLASDELNPEQKEQLKEQMGKLAEQLQKLGQSQGELAKQLENAGVSPGDAKKLAEMAASDPDAVKKALEQMKQLTPEQIQKLAEQCKSQGQCQNSMKSMSEACKNMGEGMGKEGMSKQGQDSMSSMASQLSEMEMMNSEMQACQAALGECTSQLRSMGQECNSSGESSGFKLGNNPWKAGDSGKRGSGSGGPGKGDGRSPDAEATDTLLGKEKANVKTGRGAIIASRYVQGDSIKGEATAEFAEAVEAATRSATEAIETMQVAPEHKSVVQGWFGRLQARTKATKPGEGASPTTPPVAPSDEKK
jgi:hypothetical protein